MKRPTTLAEALRALDDSEARLEALLAASFEGMAISVDGRVVITNDAGAQLMGLTREECLGRTVAELIPAEAAKAVMARIREGSEEPYELTVERPDGSVVHAQILGRNVIWDGQVARATVMRDITHERLAQASLRENERRFRELADFLPVMVGEADAAGRLTFINRVGIEVLGFDSDQEVLGRSVIEIVAPEDRERATENLRRRLAGDELGPQQYVDLRKDGSRFPALHYIAVIQSDGRPAGVRTAVIDLTERIAAEEERQRLHAQMLRSQKLESLGVLAGGIAHDFNNVLATVLGNAEVALLDLPVYAPAREPVVRIKRASLRASELVSELLAYAGKGQGQRIEIDVNELVEGMTDLLEVSATKRAIVERALAPHLPFVLGDASQLRQVLMNLVANAAESLGADGGSVRVSSGLVESVDVTREELAFGREPRDGPFVCIEVADTGIGMDHETLPRIFEPFFTTKFAGRGLGLAAVLGVVQAHGGAILVSSTPGAGSRFRLLLPAVSPPVDAAAEQAPARSPALDDVHLEGTILIVDDDRMLLDATRAMMEHLGLRVIVAADGPAAIDRFAERADIDAVLLDWTMPRMSGRRVLDALRARRPEVPIVLTSGFDEEDAVGAFKGVELQGFLHKPFRLDALVEVLQRVLDGHG